MNIYEKLLCITSEIKNVNKNLEVGVGKNSYKAVGEADVLHAVKQLENAYGVYSYPCKREIVDRAILETEKEYNGNVTRSNQVFLRIETTYRFVNIAKPEEFIEITTYGCFCTSNRAAPSYNPLHWPKHGHACRRYRYRRPCNRRCRNCLPRDRS